MTLKTDILETPDGGPVTLTGQSAAKAWTNLNGTGTIAERDSFGHSSYTDNGTGDYTNNLSITMSSAEYGIMCSGGHTAPYQLAVMQHFNSYPPTSTEVRLYASYQHSTGVTDAPFVGLSIHGDLA